MKFFRFQLGGVMDDDLGKFVPGVPVISDKVILNSTLYPLSSRMVYVDRESRPRVENNLILEGHLDRDVRGWFFTGDPSNLEREDGALCLLLSSRNTADIGTVDSSTGEVCPARSGDAQVLISAYALKENEGGSPEVWHQALCIIREPKDEIILKPAGVHPYRWLVLSMGEDGGPSVRLFEKADGCKTVFVPRQHWWHGSASSLPGHVGMSVQ